VIGDGEALAAGGAPSGAGDAFERAVAALGHRERTVAELRDWLVERGFPAAEVEAALARLIEIGELDDERFARRYAEDKRELRGWGADRIRTTLSERGVELGLIEAAVAGEASDEIERAVGLLERRGEPAADDRARGRALAYLARRGYDSELAYAAVRAYERSQGA
jgi:regulatory protein